MMPGLNKRRSSQPQMESGMPASGQDCREIKFVLEYRGAEHVYLCGDFNQWRPACLRMVGDPNVGLWEKRLILALGRYEYKFVVDGKWLPDPDARENISNIHGSLNSVVEVAL